MQNLSRFEVGRSRRVIKCVPVVVAYRVLYLIMSNAAQIHDVQFSLSGDSFLVANGSNQAKLFDRNGIELSVASLSILPLYR